MHVFVISLPNEKYSRWVDQIKCVLNDKKVSPKELELVIECLNYAAFVIHLAHYLLNIFRNLLKKNEKIKLIPPIADTIADFNLWIRFLTIAHEEIDINLIVER